MATMLEELEAAVWEAQGHSMYAEDKVRDLEAQVEAFEEFVEKAMELPWLNSTIKWAVIEVITNARDERDELKLHLERWNKEVELLKAKEAEAVTTLQWAKANA